ncbi:MAG TPA: COX15/CtaA family protein [Gaiellaceae bacterium]|jgi:cytochrome c oxidase assembly protein subunit 15|nr:COX15/CtaA family protein [Gaiellaceae bacterium]
MSEGQSLGHVSARLRRFELSPAQLLRLAVVELGALWLIVLTGAAVRLTDSGLGCRHWPGCERGQPLPEKSGHAFIEFGNRLFGAITIAAVLLGWLAARRTPGLPRWVVQLSLGLFVGTLLQAPIGLLAVASDLRWPIVILHLLLSMVLLAGATVLVLEVRGVQVGRIAPLVPLELRRLGLVFAGACFVLILSGSFATAAGPHSGGGKADKIDRFARLDPVVYAHGAVVGVFLLAFLFSLGYLAARRERAGRLFAFGAGVFALLLVQMGLGELQWRTHLPWGLVLVHVFLAATVWMGTVALATLFWRPNVDLADR